MEDKIRELLKKSDKWSLVDNKLVGKFEFTDYAEVRVFVGKIAAVADELNHHPTVTFSYNWVCVETTTHDQGNSVTDKDVELVTKILEQNIGS